MAFGAFRQEGNLETCARCPIRGNKTMGEIDEGLALTVTSAAVKIKGSRSLP